MARERIAAVGKRMIEQVRSWVNEIVVRMKPKAPVLEVGSYNVNGTIRDLFPTPYVGLDMREGPGVDLVADICDHGAARKFPDYNTIVCVETLEHVADPQLALDRMRGVLADGGLFIASWPFIHDVHDYPSDYWRVTPAGFTLLLERAGFSDIHCERRWPEHTVATARAA